MSLQVSLKNEPVAPWKEVGCCEACWMAKEDRCVCKCRGQFHGVGNGQNSSNDVVCVWCGEPLTFTFEKGWVHACNGQMYKTRPDGTDDHCALPKRSG